MDKPRGLEPFIVNRILSLISLPWSERDFAKYITENPNKLKLICVAVIEGLACNTEPSSNSDGWVSAKGSLDNLAKTLETLSTNIQDKQISEHIQNNWNTYFSHSGTPSKKVNSKTQKKSIKSSIKTKNSYSIFI